MIHIEKLELIALFEALKTDIDKAPIVYIDDIDYDEEEYCQPYISVTIGYTPATKQWDYQTGDNSFTGGAYLHPKWAVVDLFEDSDCNSLTSDVFNQLAE